MIIMNIYNYRIMNAASDEPATGMIDGFMKMSLGSLGAAQLSCLEENYARPSGDLKLNCLSSAATLEKISYIGLIFNSNTNCKKV